MFIVRTFVFKLYESPKFYLAHGQDEKALDVVFSLAKYNGVPAPGISLEKLQRIENETLGRLGLQGSPKVDQTRRLSRRQLIAHNLRELRGNYLKALFNNRKITYSTTVIVLI
ncbi:uncharacterized protein N7498_001621 [Penicillium cinerascens]|uniref:Uncharacterized protein n=1 Tax=Penicillium cinerascens TaxID=70096 RepID=A0A9W9NA68_9EURO|nr:uncharacterized protein N7498_001621 [Penicillium cinerascens]KAJ5215214.1 hypothetical protein N7498_001621 [Penicillium cinerascens]